MRLERSVDIDAAPETVWAVLTDVEQWPAWTDSVTDVERLDEGALDIGSRVRVKQPSLPAMVWQVTEVEPNRSFTWSTKAAGVVTVAGHRLTPRVPGGVTATLDLRQSGPLAPVVGLLTGSMTRRYMDLEAEGLKRRSEAGQEAG